MALWETVVVLLCVITMTSACSCMPAHPQEHFCQAQFVIRGKVISGPVQVLPDNYFVSSNVLGRFLAERVYTFRITKTYKGAAAIKKTDSLKVYGSRGRSVITKIYTPSKLNSCRVDLDVGKVYVIAGYIGRKKLSISGCSLRMEWEKITKKQRSGFARKYGRSCECVHQKCYKDCGKESQEMACNFEISRNPANECRDRYGYCQLSSDGRSCSWTTNALYRKCMKKIP
ncbi:tissue inhibitor of metalloproteinase-like [Actinia tenebrosa]|uniref:Tissue inhibitor of metalloproteinase-like n=1 Tax=Actinia tenebrosa TaxID=6105 RepID=A0A6P8I982_ACTTE|nr:tissue inhibitor of metalloproteinase-like [Actinia tenebrosa]